MPHDNSPKGALHCHVKIPLSQLRIPTGRRRTSWLFTVRGEFASGITQDKFIQYSESRIWTWVFHIQIPKSGHGAMLPPPCSSVASLPCSAEAIIPYSSEAIIPYSSEAIIPYFSEAFLTCSLEASLPGFSETPQNLTDNFPKSHAFRSSLDISPNLSFLVEAYCTSTPFQMFSCSTPYKRIVLSFDGKCIPTAFYRADFEELVSSLLSRLEVPMKSALEQSGRSL